MNLIVALRKESVDRNHVVLVVPSGCWLSLSARRAWIEIYNSGNSCTQAEVALRKESVDRNSSLMKFNWNLIVALRKESVDRNVVSDSLPALTLMSLSARRAWIEMLASRLADMSAAVALRKESVDRNKWVLQS